MYSDICPDVVFHGMPQPHNLKTEALVGEMRLADVHTIFIEGMKFQQNSKYQDSCLTKCLSPPPPHTHTHSGHQFRLHVIFSPLLRWSSTFFLSQILPFLPSSSRLFEASRSGQCWAMCGRKHIKG